MSDTSLAKPQVAPADVQVIPRKDGPTPSQALLPSQDQLQVVTQLAHMAAASSDMNSYNANEGGVAKAQLTLLKGLALGIPAIDALDHVYVVHGKTALSGQMMLRLILVAWDEHHRGQGAPIEWDSEMDPSVGQRCRMRRHPGEEWSQWFEFTREKADAAGLLYYWKDGQKREAPTWNAYFVDMCRWRCIAAAAKQVYPDVIQGCYLREELTNGIGLRPNAARSTDTEPPTKKRSQEDKKPQPLPKGHPKLNQISKLLDENAELWGKINDKGLKEMTSWRDDLRKNMLKIEFKDKKPIWLEEHVDRMIEGLTGTKEKFAEKLAESQRSAPSDETPPPAENTSDEAPSPPPPEGEKTE